MTSMTWRRTVSRLGYAQGKEHKGNTGEYQVGTALSSSPSMQVGLWLAILIRSEKDLSITRSDQLRKQLATGYCLNARRDRATAGHGFGLTWTTTPS